MRKPKSTTSAFDQFTKVLIFDLGQIRLVLAQDIRARSAQNSLDFAIRGQFNALVAWASTGFSDLHDGLGRWKTQTGNFAIGVFQTLDYLLRPDTPLECEREFFILLERLPYRPLETIRRQLELNASH